MVLGHGRQELAPGVLEYVPDSQGVQEVAEVVPEYVPNAQGVHAAELDVLNEPGEQATGSVADMPSPL